MCAFPFPQPRTSLRFGEIIEVYLGKHTVIRQIPKSTLFPKAVALTGVKVQTTDRNAKENLLRLLARAHCQSCGGLIAWKGPISATAATKIMINITVNWAEIGRSALYRLVVGLKCPRGHY